MPLASIFGSSHNQTVEDNLSVQGESQISERTTRLKNRNLSKEVHMAPNYANNSDSESGGESRGTFNPPNNNPAQISLAPQLPAPKAFMGNSREEVREWHSAYIEYVAAAEGQCLTKPAQVHQLAGVKGVNQLARIMKNELVDFVKNPTAEEIMTTCKQIRERDHVRRGSGIHLMTSELIEKYLSLFQEIHRTIDPLKEALAILTRVLTSMAEPHLVCGNLEGELFSMEETLDDMLRDANLMTITELFSLSSQHGENRKKMYEHIAHFFQSQISNYVWKEFHHQWSRHVLTTEQRNTASPHFSLEQFLRFISEERRSVAGLLRLYMSMRPKPKNPIATKTAKDKPTPNPPAKIDKVPGRDGRRYPGVCRLCKKKGHYDHVRSSGGEIIYNCPSTYPAERVEAAKQAALKYFNARDKPSPSIKQEEQPHTPQIRLCRQAQTCCFEATWYDPSGPGSLTTEMITDTGADYSIMGLPREQLQKAFPNLIIKKKTPVSVRYGDRTHLLANYVTLNCRTRAGTPYTYSADAVDFYLPSAWPKPEVLLGSDFLAPAGLINPIGTRLEHAKRDVHAGLDPVTGQHHDDLPMNPEHSIRRANLTHVVHGNTIDDGKHILDEIPFSINDSPDELDEVTAPPEASVQLTPHTDPDLHSALNSLKESGKEAILLLARNVDPCPPQELQRHLSAFESLIDEFGFKIFRLRFYPGDGPAKVTPWIDPVKRPDQRATKMRAQRRQFSRGAQIFLTLIMKTLISCGFLTDEGHILSPSEAFAISPAVVVAKTEQGQFRVAFDMREANNLVEYVNFPFPSAEELIRVFGGKTIYSAFDFCKAFWQLPLDPSSQGLYTLASHNRLYRSRRVIQGAKNSMAAMTRATSEIFADLIDNGDMVTYADDGAIGATTISDMMRLLRQAFELCAEKSLFINPAKISVFQTSLPFLGKIIRDGAVHPNPKMIQGILELAPPKTVADIMSLRGIVTWISSHLPNLSSVISDILALEVTLMASSKRKTKQAAARIMVGPHWTPTHTRALERLRQLVANSSENYIPTDADRLALFTDASDRGWAGVLFAFPMDQLPLKPSHRNYRTVGWVSGLFSSAERNYGIPEKEVLAVMRSMEKFAIHLYGFHPFFLYVDHQNMAKVWALGHATDADTSRVVAGRVQRWAARMSHFNCFVYHIPGEDNLVADYSSRHFLDSTSSVSQGEGHMGDDVKQIRHVYGFEDTRVQATTKVTYRYPSRKEIRELQDKFIADNKGKDKIEFFPNGVPERINGNIVQREAEVWVAIIDESPKVWIPKDNDNEASKSLRARIVVIAHAGVAGHQGRNATINEIKRRFTWKGISNDVDNIVSKCVNCWSAHRPGDHPRAFFPTFVATKPGQCVQADFVKTHDSGTKDREIRDLDGNSYPYLLVLKDKMSRLVMLRPCRDCTSKTAAEIIWKEWIPQRGMPEYFYSDGGPHFTGRVMKELIEALPICRKLTIPYSPWANGSVERAGGEVIRICQALCSENQIATNQWYKMLPTVEMHLNSRKMGCLGGRSPIGVSQGTEPPRPVDIILDFDKAYNQASEISVDALQEENIRVLLEHVADLQKKAVETSDEVLQIDRDRKNSRWGLKKCQLKCGDWVMAVIRNTRRNKLMPKYDGPHQIIDIKGDQEFILRDTLTGRTRSEHANHIERYDDRLTSIPEEMREQINHDRHGFVVECVGDLIFRDDIALVKMFWKGYEHLRSNFNTHEDILYVEKLVPKKLHDYLERLRKEPGPSISNYEKLKRLYIGRMEYPFPN